MRKIYSVGYSGVIFGILVIESHLSEVISRRLAFLQAVFNFTQCFWFICCTKPAVSLDFIARDATHRS